MTEKKKRKTYSKLINVDQKESVKSIKSNSVPLIIFFILSILSAIGIYYYLNNSFDATEKSGYDAEGHQLDADGNRIIPKGRIN